MDYNTLWKLTRETWEAVIPSFEPVFDRFCLETDMDEWRLGLLLAALTFEPETTTAARLQVRGPYTAAAGYQTRLVKAAEKGYLDELRPGEFYLSDSGRVEITRVVDQAHQAMVRADPLSPADGERLAVLLGRLVTTSLRTPPPPETWSIQHSHKLMPAMIPPLPYIEQAISCLSGYRDDAHLAAWRPSNLTATALEALTLLWRGTADSLDALNEQLQRRGHAPQVYAKALAELREWGYVEGPDDAPRVTKSGRVFREQVERDTDRYFFAPWSCLSNADQVEMAGLLTRLRDGLVS